MDGQTVNQLQDKRDKLWNILQNARTQIAAMNAGTIPESFRRSEYELHASVIPALLTRIDHLINNA